MRIFKSKLFITILIFILTFGGIAGGITAVNSISGNENVYAAEDYSFSKITENVVRLFNKDTAPSALLGGDNGEVSTPTPGDGTPVDVETNADYSWFTKGISAADTSRVGNFGAFMGYAREGIVMWITSLIAMGKVTFTYDQLASVTGMTAKSIVNDAGAIGDGIDSNPLWMYSQYGKVLKEMGLDQNRSSGIVGALLMFVKLIGGVFLLLVYLFSMLVPAVFSLVATFLRYFNPFTFMVTIPGIQDVYRAFYSFGRWIAAPLFLALMFVGIYVFGPKGANIHGDQASFSSKLFKFIKRFAFIILGIPLIGFLYTIAINNLAENLGNMGTGFADRMLARNMIDFGQWASQERLAIPKGRGLEVEVDNSKNKTRLAPTLTSLNNVRGYAYAINTQTSSVGQKKEDGKEWTVNPDEENAITRYQSIDEKDSGAVQKIDNSKPWDQVIGDQESEAGAEKRGSTGLEAILGYMLSNVYTAAAFESDTKAELLDYMNKTPQADKAKSEKIANVLKWYAEKFTEYDGNGPLVGFFSGNDAQGRFYDLFKIDSYEGNLGWSNNIMLNGGLEVRPGSGDTANKIYFYNNSAAPSKKGTPKDGTVIDPEGSSRVLRFSGLSSMSMYNYLTTNFGSDSMDVYASADNSSDFVKEEHLSVHMVGQTFLHRALLLFQVIVMLLCMTIIGLVYGFAVLFANIKRGFQIIFNMPFMLVGSLQAAAKVVIYTVVLFLEVFGTMFLYSVVENMFGAVMDVSMSMLEDVGTDLKLDERSNKTIESLPKLMSLRSNWVDNYDPQASASNVELDSGYTYSDTSGLVANTDIEADLADISTNSLDDAYAYAATGTSYAQNGVAIKMLFGPIVTIVVGIIFTVISIKYRKVIVQSLEEMIANVIQKLVVGSGSAPPVTGGSGGGMGKALLGGAAAGAAGVLARAAGGGGKGGDKAGDNAGNVEEANSKAAAKAEDSKDGGGKGSKGSGEKQVEGRAGIPGPVPKAGAAGGAGGEGGGISDKEDAAGGGGNEDAEKRNVNEDMNLPGGYTPDKGKNSAELEGQDKASKEGSLTSQVDSENSKGKGNPKDLAKAGGGGNNKDNTASATSTDDKKKADSTDSLATTATDTKTDSSASESGAGGSPAEENAENADELNDVATSEEQKGLGQESQETSGADGQSPEGDEADAKGIGPDGDPATKGVDIASENPADGADGANKADGADGDTPDNKELAKDDKDGEQGTPEKGNSKQGFADKAADALKHPGKTAANIGKGLAAGATAALGGAAGVEAIKNAKGLGGKLAATAKGLKQGIPSAIANSAAGRYANNVANQAKAVNKSAGDVKTAANARRTAIGQAGEAKQRMKEALKTGGKNSPAYEAAKKDYTKAKTAAREQSKKALTGAFATAGNALKTAGSVVAPAAKVAGNMAKAGMQVGAGTMVAGIGAYTGNIGLMAHGARMGLDGIGRHEGHLRQAVDNVANNVSFAQAAFGAGISGTSMGDIYNSYQNMQATGGLEQRTQNTDHGSGGINHGSGGTTTGGNTYMQPGVSHDAVTNNSPPIQPQAPVGQTTESRVNTPRGKK